MLYDCVACALTTLRNVVAYSGVTRHASDTRIGLMDSTVPVEAVVGV